MRPMLFALFVCVGSAPLAAGAEPDLASVRAAVNRAIPWLERDMVVWRQSNDCAACHHGPMYLWSAHLAKRQGYSIDERQLQSYAKWMIEEESARVFPAHETVTQATAAPSAADRMTTAMMGNKNLSQPTLYLAHALNAMPAGDLLVAVGRRKLAEHWSAAQMDDGSFAGRKGWPPIFNTPQILTLFAETALQDRPADSDGFGESTSLLNALHRRTANFLRNQTSDATHQGIVLRLLMQSQAAGPQPRSLLSELRSLQREDGGWPQLPDRQSDAFATGQSLYVMYRAGVPISDDAIVHGLNFLSKSQAADGTWPMTSQANPETGRPAENLNPITYAATAWAVIGMATYVGSR